MNKLISILIPFYNAEKFIKKVITSCLNQTYDNIEILLFDDGSTDNTYDEIREFIDNEKIKYIRSEHVGIGLARNKLIQYASGHYFIFVDADDFLTKNAIKYLYNKSKFGELDIVVGRAYVKFSKFIIPFAPSWWWVPKMSSKHYVKSNICAPWGALVKKSYFISLNVEFQNYTYEDVGLMPYVFLRTEKFAMARNVTYFYLRHSKKKSCNSLSSFSTYQIHKIYSLRVQISNLLFLFKNSNLDKNKKMRTSINGVLYEPFPLFLFLAKSLTKDREFIMNILYNSIRLIQSFGYKKLKFSKTFWKSLAFFYINIFYKEIHFFNKKYDGNTSVKNYNNFFIKKRYYDCYDLDYYIENQNKFKKNVVVKVDFDKLDQISYFKKVKFFLITFSSYESFQKFLNDKTEYSNVNKIPVAIDLLYDIDEWTIVSKLFKKTLLININDKNKLELFKSFNYKILLSTSSENDFIDEVNYVLNFKN